ncbi:MAG: hypothetical protein IJ897_02215 [Prevotella sp.]|nr:hypothetical protein [Prevotella sp.]
MKKTYINPTLLVVNVSTVGMIANSTPVNLKDAEDYSEGGTISGTRRGRFSGWDEDFDSEE